MAFLAKTRERIQPPSGFAILILACAAALGLLVAYGTADTFRLIAIGIGSAAIVPLIIFRPEIGLIIIFAALSLEDIFTELPLASATLTGIGALTLVGYLLQSRSRPILTTARYPQFFWALAFIAWFVISDPIHAFGTDHFWVGTYIQLLVLTWLASELMTIKRIKWLTGVFVIATAISTVVALSQVQLTNSIKTADRGIGLSQNENELASYLVVAFVFSVALCYQFRKTWWLSLGTGALAMLSILGVVASVSRAGFIALAVVIVLVCLFSRKLTGISGKQYVAALIILFFVLVLTVALIPANYWSIVSEGFQSIAAGENARSTYAIRLDLWTIALRLWSQNPLQGIGIGQFQYMNPRGFVVHNMYLSILTENGLIGFIFYILWLGSTFLGFWRVIWRSPNKEHVALATAWFLALIGFCIVGTVDSFQYLKITWLAAGISIVFQQTLLPHKQIIPQ